MLTYILRRLLLIPPTLLGITAVVFFVMAATPGGIGASLLNNEGNLDPYQKRILEAYYKKRYDLDKPPVVQYLKWLNKISPVGVKPVGTGYPEGLSVGLKWPDLGESFSQHRPVGAVIADALPVTLLLELLSLPIFYGISIWTGIAAARARGKALDLGLGSLLIALWSMPEIWIGIMMIGFLTNRVRYVHWFPTNGLHDVLAESMQFLPTWGTNGFQRGWLLDTGWHLALPLICLSYGSFAFLSRLQRGALLETLNQDFVRTARAKGVSERVVLYRHAFRNSLMPLITVAASILPGLIAGSVIVETIFGVPGMGKLTIDAVEARDRELLLSVTLIASILQLIGFLIADLAYAVADPRVSYVD